MPTLPGLRPLRHVPAREPDRRRHVRPRRARPGTADGAGRRDRSRHRAGALGDADARDAAHGVPPRRRPRDRVHAGQQPARRDARRRPLHHRLHRPARRRRPTGCASTAAARRRSCTSRRRRGACARYNPTSFPLAAMPLSTLRPAVSARFDAGRHPGAAVRRHLRVSRPPQRAVRRGRASRPSCAPTTASRWPSCPRAPARRRARHSRKGAPQEDDMTVVLVKREAASVTADRSFRRSFDSLEDDLRVHRGILRAPRHRPRAPAHGRPRASRSCSRTWSSTARRATPTSASTMATIAGRRRSDADRL